MEKINVNERLKELKGKKFKLNLKKCGVFIRYTLPTALYIVGAGLGSYKLNSNDFNKYEHMVTEYTLGDETPKSLEPFYSSDSEPNGSMVKVETTWNKHEYKDGYYKVVYTFDISKINQEELLSAFQANDEAYVQNILSILPELEVNVIDESNPLNLNEGGKILYLDDSLTGNKDLDVPADDAIWQICSIISLYLIKYILCDFFFGDRSDNGKIKFRKIQFPFSLIDGLKGVNTEIKEVKNEESQLRLTMKH